MRLKPGKHAFPRLGARLYGTPLLVLPEKLEQIAEVYEMHRHGLAWTDQEIRERLILAGLFDDDDDDEEDDDSPYQLAPGGVAVITISGVMSQRVSRMEKSSGGVGAEDVASAFQAALDDDEVTSILLNFDSPGGEVAGIDELSTQIFQARGKKPITAVANPLMASAAYYIASAADQVIATPSGRVGSIGVLSRHIDRSKAESASGRANTLIFAGKHKVDGSPYGPLTDQARATFQETVDGVYQKFTGAVARNRGTTADAVQAGYGEGKVLLPEAAVKAGLADRVATFDQVLSEMSARGQSLRTAATPPPTPKIPSFRMENLTVDKTIKAALVARGLIKADTDDAMAAAVLGAFFNARGESVPSDAAATVAALGQTAKPAEPKPSAPPAPPAVQPTAEQQRIAQEAARAERQRIDEITTRGQLLGVDKKLIQASIDAGDDIGAALVKFTNRKAGDERPVDPHAAPRATGSEADVFANAAIEVLERKLLPRLQINTRKGADGDGKRKSLSAAARDMRYMRLIDIATISLRNAGVRTAGLDPSDISEAFLEQGEKVRYRLSDWYEGEGAWDGSYQTPSDYPNILSAVAGKIIDRALETNTATFRDWAYPLPSVPDFKPKTIVARGGFPELPLIEDGDNFVQTKFAEEASFIQADTYGTEVKLTPVMIANDDLDEFAQDVARNIQAMDLTLNRLCVNLIAGNVICADGQPLFGEAHNNLVAGADGGAPSVAQTAAMRLLMRQQLDVGGFQKMRVGPRIALVPSTFETAGEQVYQVPPDGIFYRDDVDVNMFRRKVTPVPEQQLDDMVVGESGIFPWFLLADPALVRAIVFVFMTGFEGGKVLMYFDPKNRCRVTTIEGRFAAAIRNWRGIVRNSGGNVSF